MKLRLVFFQTWRSFLLIPMLCVALLLLVGQSRAQQTGSSQNSGTRSQNSANTQNSVSTQQNPTQTFWPNMHPWDLKPPAPAAAERQALEQVSFAANTIIDLLNKEPGLFLEVKKALVRKAFEQGRLLDPDDLTDMTVLTLIREDLHVRVIATQEIVDRGYIRVNPNREELQQMIADQANGNPIRMLRMEMGVNPDQLYLNSPFGTQTSPADQYWRMRNQTPPGQQSPNNQPDQSYPITPNVPPQYQYPGSTSGIQINRARLDTDNSSSQLPYSSTSSSDESGGMARISPNELPSLLASSSTGQMQGSGLSSQLAAYQAQQGGSGMSLSDLLDQAQQTGLNPQLSQRASLDNRNQFPMRPLQPLEQDNHPVIRHRANPYANVPSLYDLYTQVSKRKIELQPFGADVFRNGTGNLDDLPMDLPVGPDYVLGPGDSVTVNLWGSISQRLQRTVDREGRLALPQVGTVLVAGKSMGDAQREVQAVLRTQFRDIDADLALSRLRTVRVYVVGFVTSPGAYDISALSTPLNALIAAGGPTDAGSMRFVRHYRGKQLVQETDLYDLILHGVRSDVKTLQPGDTILVPPVGGQVTIEGMVRRPAIYELHGETSLSDVLELAGGVLPSGTLRHIDVERLQAHEMHSMMSLNLPDSDNQVSVEKALDEFKIQEGDKIRISPIRPYSEKTVYLDGHVFHPGKYPYADGMKVKDLIKSYNDLLPEPYQQHAEIIRLESPDYRPEVISFNLADAMLDKGQEDIALKPFDTVRVFGRYDFEDPPEITVTGEVRDPGDHPTNGATHLSDAVFLSGGVTPDALIDDVQIYRKEGNTVRVMSADLGKALSGNSTENLLLQNRDRIVIHRDLSKLDPATVVIQGEVANPGKYALGSDMTVVGLVRAAGGIKRGAYIQSADLARYVVDGGSRVVGEHQEVPLALALAGQPDTDVRLHDGDVLTVRQLSGWNDVSAVITVKGEVVHPGGYGIKEGERLSSILQRAGGFRENAYPYGAILLRKNVREMEEQNQAELLNRVESQQVAIAGMPESSLDLKQAKDATMQQWQVTVNHLKNAIPSGRLVIHVSKDIGRWANTTNDVVVQKDDMLIIPKRPSSVMVTGQVYNATAVSYRPGKSAKWYLGQSGGPTALANKKGIFVVKADGSVIGGSSGSNWWLGSSMSASLQPGDAIVVPERAVAGPKNWTPLLAAAQVAASVAVATSYLLK